MSFPEKSFINEALTNVNPSQIKKLSGLPRGVQAFVSLLLMKYGREVLTPEASDYCDIRNIPDLVMKSRDRLAVLGLSIERKMVDRPNKFGQIRLIGSWELIISEPGLWFGVEAVNDEG